MRNIFEKFSFPYLNTVLVFSAVMILLPIVFINLFDVIKISNSQRYLLKFIFLVPTFISTTGFIYCILGYHFKTIRGDELKLKIHLESLNVAFTAILISIFIFIFFFLNFAPRMLNWIFVMVAVVGIIAYLLAVELIKEKYQ